MTIVGDHAAIRARRTELFGATTPAEATAPVGVTGSVLRHCEICPEKLGVLCYKVCTKVREEYERTAKDQIKVT